MFITFLTFLTKTKMEGGGENQGYINRNIFQKS